MKITLKYLKIKNFKGVFDSEYHFDGSTNIFGANESGKSTIYTAFNWLLTGKDEFDRKDFEIKNTAKPELNNQPHEVEAEIVVDDDNGMEIQYNLKRLYKEKWVKQRGSIDKTFEGHTTEYWVNDVPCSQSEYQSKIDSFLNSKILKLVTNPNYFTSLKWDEQRRGLIAIAGVISREDILKEIATPGNDFCELISVLDSGKTLDEWKSQLSAKKGLLKKKLVEYAPRIDEANRALPEEMNWLELEKKSIEIQSQIKAIEDTLADVSKALAERQKGVLELQKNLYSKEAAATQLKSEIEASVRAQTASGTADKNRLEIEINAHRATINNLLTSQTNKEESKKGYNNRVEILNEQLNILRGEWNDINNKVFEFDESDCSCPTCKQSLPAYDIDAKREELRANFNNANKTAKDSKVAQSELIKVEISQLHNKIQQLEETEYNRQIAESNEKLFALETEFKNISAKEKNANDIQNDVNAALESNKELSALLEEVKALTDQYNEAKTNQPAADNSVATSTKLSLTIELDDIKKQLNTKELIAKGKERIDQLTREESETAQEIAEVEGKEYDIELYSKAHMAILENRVNEMFYFVKWRLFETQVNGAVVETCVCEYKGVPYPTLNTAARLIAGVDILNTLSQHYNVYAPVFCDNRESVTLIPKTKSQIISLFVSAIDKIIRVVPEQTEYALK